MFDPNEECDPVFRPRGHQPRIEVVDESQPTGTGNIRQQHVDVVLRQGGDGCPVNGRGHADTASSNGRISYISVPGSDTVRQQPERSVISVPSLPEIISDRLRKDISRGVYKPGPVRIRELAERFGVSPMPVREALRRLEAEGLVSFQRNRQIRINSLSADEVDEVFQIRTQLEPFALRRAVPRLQQDERARQVLADLVLRMDNEMGDPDAWRTSNEEFHAGLYRGAGMPRLEAILASLWANIEPYIRFYLRIAANVQLAQQQHHQMLALIEAGAADAAADVLVAHIAISRDALMNAMLSQADEP
jgi:DNA-binding GntR family transcriptional regulator